MPVQPVTPMAESWRTRLLRWKFNLYPAFRRTGARVEYIAEDRLEGRIRLPLTRATRNLHGTIFGGAMYAAVDPLHAVLLAANLGPDYLIWMKRAEVEFRRPGRGVLRATARITPAELDEIRRALAAAAKIERRYEIALVDEAGQTVAACALWLHLRRRAPAETPMEQVVFT